MSKVLVIAEHADGQLNPSTAKCIACAASIPDASVDVALLSADGEALAAEIASLASVARVIRVDADINDKPLSVQLAPQVVALAGDYTHILGPSTTFGKDLMPAVAALLGVNQVSDVMEVVGANRFKRPIYAGNAILTVETPQGLPVVATVRTASYQAVEGGGNAVVDQVSVDAEIPAHTRFIERRTAASDRPDLQTAARVVSGGRALGSAENFEVIYKLADALGAAVGASRAAVDAGYVPNEMQVGQTGKIIAPALYVAIGISGAIQHLTGIKDAGTIVAINKDPEAPIFEVADIGLVGDLFTVVPELEAAVSSA
jgi:electron transfer flavoprotein alpha subunit